MNHYTLILSLLTSLLLLAQCKSEDKFFTDTESPLHYQSNKILQLGEVRFEAKMKVSKEGDSLLLLLKTKNLSEKEQTVDYWQASLASNEGLRAYPVSISSENKSLFPLSDRIDTIIFTPVNQKDLYYHTNLRGPVNAAYEFMPGGILNLGHLSQSITLRSDSVQNRLYRQSKQEAPNIAFFNIAQEDSLFLLNLKSKLNDAVDYSSALLAVESNKTTEAQSAFHVSHKELLMGGVVLQIKAYHRQGNAYSAIRIVNQQSLPLEVNFNEFSLIDDKKEVHQPNWFEISEKPTASIENQDKILLKKGQRVACLLTYSDQVASDEIRAILPSIAYGDTRQLFPKIPLVQVSLPQ